MFILVCAWFFGSLLHIMNIVSITHTVILSKQKVLTGQTAAHGSSSESECS